MAADIRKVRPPEPYKGKGIHYLGEHVRRKAGKAGKVELGDGQTKSRREACASAAIAACARTLRGTPERPRLNVFRSLAEIYAQVIDDAAGQTLVCGFDASTTSCAPSWTA